MRAGIDKISQCRLGEMLFLTEGTARAKALRGGMGAKASHHECVEETDLP